QERLPVLQVGGGGKRRPRGRRPIGKRRLAEWLRWRRAVAPIDFLGDPVDIAPQIATPLGLGLGLLDALPVVGLRRVERARRNTQRGGDEEGLPHGHQLRTGRRALLSDCVTIYFRSWRFASSMSRRSLSRSSCFIWRGGCLRASWPPLLWPSALPAASATASAWRASAFVFTSG